LIMERHMSRLYWQNKIQTFLPENTDSILVHCAGEIRVTDFCKMIVDLKNCVAYQILLVFFLISEFSEDIQILDILYCLF